MANYAKLATWKSFPPQSKHPPPNSSKTLNITNNSLTNSKNVSHASAKVANPTAVAAYRPLSGYSLASRLSYFLWSSMPDDELFKLAAEGKSHGSAKVAAKNIASGRKSRESSSSGNASTACWTPALPFSSFRRLPPLTFMTMKVLARASSPESGASAAAR